MAYQLLGIAIAPGVAIALFMYFRDSSNREPLKWLFLCFLLGMLSTVLAIYLEDVVYIGLKQLVYDEDSAAFKILSAFIRFAFIEEMLKYCMLRWSVYNKKTFDEPLDGIVYAVMVSMGFATIENILYVYQYGLSVGIMRMFLSVPGHACFAILMGYYVGLAKFNKGRKGNGYIFIGLGLAILFHGLYDSFLMLSESSIVQAYISSGMLVLGAIGSYIIALILSIRAIRIHRKASKIATAQANAAKNEHL